MTAVRGRPGGMSGLPTWSTMTPVDPVAVPERLMTSVRALGPAGYRWLEDLPDILASLAADWSIAYGRPLGGGNAAHGGEHAGPGVASGAGRPAAHGGGQG